MSSDESVAKPELREIIDLIGVSGRSIKALLKKFTQIAENYPNQNRIYTAADLKREYTSPAAGGDDDVAVMGSRWTGRAVRDEVIVDCEITLLNKAARLAMVAAALPRGDRLAATILFSAGTGEDEQYSELSLLTSFYEGGPQKHQLGSAEMNGTLMLAADITPEQDAALFGAAKIMGVQTVYSYFAREAVGLAREFFVEVPQMTGSDMVKAAGRIVTHPLLSQ